MNGGSAEVGSSEVLVTMCVRCGSAGKQLRVLRVMNVMLWLSVMTEWSVVQRTYEIT